MALDNRRLADDGDRLDHVRVQCALREEVNLSELRRFGLEDLNKGSADDPPLLLGVHDAGESIEKRLRRVDKDKRKMKSLEALADLRGFIEPQHAVIDED